MNIVKPKEAYNPHKGGIEPFWVDERCRKKSKGGSV